MEYTWKVYVQARVGFSPRPLAWTCVGGANDRKAAREVGLAWVREVNSYQKNPVLYWVHVVYYGDTP